MKILWITMESVLPINTGGRIGVFKRMEQLAKHDEIFLFYPYDNKSEEKYIDELKKYCKEVHCYYRKDNFCYAITNLYKYPFTVGSRCIEKMQDEIKECIKNNNIDLINVDFPHMCVNLLDLDVDIPIILNEHNIEWKVYRRISDSQNDFLKKIAYFIDSYRLKSYEKMILKKIPMRAFTFVSDEDMKQYCVENNVDNTKCSYIPIGADIRKIKIKKVEPLKKIIFVGKMSYGPNIEAVIHFVKNIYPNIKKRINNLKFYIIGREPDPQLLKLQSEDIIVTGCVESVEDYYYDADLVVIPLLNGGGAKIKLLEAISYCRPIVSTTVGVEGTDFRNNRLIYISDDDYEFADYCVELLVNRETAEAKAFIAYQFFKDNYSWEGIGSLYRTMLERVAKK